MPLKDDNASTGSSVRLIEINPDDVRAPFPVRRVYILFDTDPAAVRGKLAHRQLRQLFHCVVGSVRVTVDDGHDRRQFDLRSPTAGLLVGPRHWYELSHFAPGTVVSVYADQPCDERE